MGWFSQVLITQNVCQYSFCCKLVQRRRCALDAWSAQAGLQHYVSMMNCLSITLCWVAQSPVKAGYQYCASLMNCLSIMSWWVGQSRTALVHQFCQVTQACLRFKHVLPCSICDMLVYWSSWHAVQSLLVAVWCRLVLVTGSSRAW